MQPNIIKAGLCSTISAAVAVSLTGLVPGPAVATPEPAASDQLAGTTVFLDPGHQGSAHSEDLNRQVDNGRGGTKACQTTGMTSLGGIPEHTINWDVTQLVKASLQALGAQVVLSRADDTGWGGCVDDRARAANRSGAAVAVSIHADSAPADQRGFHLIVPELPIPDSAADHAQSGPGRTASTAVRDAYLASGFPAATYAGVSNGLQTRADVAGPALTQVPLVFVEMGNGANAEDAALLESREGQLKHAVAIATGVVAFLLNKPVSAEVPVSNRDAVPGPVPAATTAPTPAQEPEVASPPATDSETSPTPAPAPAGTPAPSPAESSTSPAPAGSDTPTPTETPAAADPPAAAFAPAPAPAPGDAPGPADKQPPAEEQQPPAADQSTVPTTPAAAPARPVSVAPKPPAGSSGHFHMPGGQQGEGPAGQQGPAGQPAKPPTGSGGHLALPTPADVTGRTGAGTQVRTASPGAPAAPAPTPRQRGTTPKNQPAPAEEEGPDLSSLGGPILAVMEMLMPLARALGMDNTAITNQLINLAYTLVGIVFGPTK
ncbi:N-acetylmuramoyl-L-alanine amidase [Nocardia asteroides]